MTHDDSGDDDPEALGCNDWFVRWLDKLLRDARSLLRTYPTADGDPDTLVGLTYLALQPRWESTCRRMPDDDRFRYVFGTMRRVAKSEQRLARRRSARFPLLGAAAEVATERSDNQDLTVEAVVRKELRRRLAAALDMFADDERLLLVLRLDGFTQQEIADRVGLERYQVARRLAPLIDRLMALLTGEDDGGSR